MGIDIYSKKIKPNLLIMQPEVVNLLLEKDFESDLRILFFLQMDLKGW
jgi:hypothetical protein